jgi:hypothetical protein
MSGSLPSALYGTRQSVSLCRVPGPIQSTKNLYRCPGLSFLPSAMVLTLGKAPLCRVLHSAKHLFAECYTRQSDQYTPFLFVFPIPTKRIKDISQISHIYIIDHHRHKYPTQTLIYKFSTQIVSTQVQKYQHKFRSINT